MAGRQNSLEALIRNHSYSTDTVRRLLKPGALGANMTPVGTLADFLEVSGAHEGVVDEFLREELNYVVVETWGAAEEGVRLLKSGVEGRATFLIHSAAEGGAVGCGRGRNSGPGLTPLRDSIRMLNGFGKTLESILPKLQHGYLVEDSNDAVRLAALHPYAFFLTPGGCFHNATVSGGKPASEGPLALKRELRETRSRLAKIETGVAQAETQAELQIRAIQDLTAQLEQRSAERRGGRNRRGQPGRRAEADGVRGSTHRAQVAGVGGGRQPAISSAGSKTQLHPAEARRDHAPGGRTRKRRDRAGCLAGELATLRQKREGLQQQAAQVTAELAGEERRRGQAAFQRIDRMYADLERRGWQASSRAHRHRLSGTSASQKARRWPSGRKSLPMRVPRRWLRRRRLPSRHKPCASSWPTWRPN